MISEKIQIQSGHVEFFQNLREHVPVGYSGFYHHFLFNFSWRFFTYT